MGLPANLDYGLYFDLSLYAVLALGLFFGFLKGFKKSLYSFLTTIVFYIVFFLTIDLAVNFLWTVQIAPLGGWLSGFMPSLSGITTLSQALPILVEQYLRPMVGDLAANVQFLALAEGLAFFAVKIVYTLLYFTIIFVVYKLICGILRAIFMPHRKLDDKYASKNRGFGALFGLLEGAVSVFVTLIMLGGLMSVAESLVSFVPETAEPPLEDVFVSPREGIYEASTSVIPLADSEGGLELPTEVEAATAMMKDFVNAYNANPIVTYSSMVTMTDQNQVELPLNLYLFDSVLSFDYQANARDAESPVVQVSIRKELSVFAEIAGLVIDSGVSGVADLSEVTPEQITGLFDKLADSDLVTSILPLGIEYAMQVSEMDNIDLPIQDLYAVDWAAEIQNLGLIAASLYQIAEDVGAFSGEEFNYQTVVLDGEDIRSFFTSLSESDLLTLAALVAIEPLLSMAGDEIQLIITPPEGLEWSDLDFGAEFLALGNILAEVVETNLTIEMITSGDYIVVLEAIQTMDLDVILSSRIIKTALINVLSGAAGIEALSFIVVPDDPDFDWETELPNIIMAVETLLELSDELGSMIGGETDTTSVLELIGALTTDQINNIFASDLLVASLSEVVMGDMLGDLPLVIPDQVLDENGYILKTEFIALATSAQTLSANLMCDIDDPATPDVDETDDECQQDMGIDISKAFSLDDEAINDLLGSGIISATVGNLLYGYGDGTEGDVLTVPASALDASITEDGIAVSCVSSDEIKLIFDAIQVLNIENLEDMDFDASIINDLSTVDDPETPDVNEDDTEALFASVIIRATITDLLNDMDLNGTTLVVPDSAKDAEGFLTTHELGSVVKAMKLVIIINDCDLPEAPEGCEPIEFDVATVLELTDDDITILLDSEVLNATIGKYMVDLGEGEDAVLTIPDSALETVQVGVDTLDVVSETEIRKIFKAVNALGITDFGNIDFDPSIINDLSTVDDPETLDVNEDDTVALFASVIIRATITDLLNDMDLNGTTLVVPDSAKDLEGYLTQEELGAVVKAMQLVITTDPITQETSFDVDAVLALEDSVEHPDITTLLTSKILNATIGKYMVDLGEGEDAVLTIPDSALETLQVGVDSVDVVTEAEIRKIFKAVNVLGLEGFTNVSFDASIVSDLETEDNLATPENEDDTAALFDSIIIRATITDLLNDMDLNGTSLIVPDSAKDLEGYLTQDELGAVVKAMKLVITTDPITQETSFDVDTVLQLTDGEVTVLLDSEVLNSTIGKYMVDLGEGEDAVLTIPDSALEIAQVGPDAISVVKDEEIRRIFKAVNVLGLEDFTNVSFDASIVSDLETEDNLATPENEDDTEALFASVIIRATITDLLNDMDLNGTTLVVPNSGKDLEGYLTEHELGAVVKAMKLVIVTDPITQETSFDVDTVLQLTDGEVDVLLDSEVLNSTIGKYMVDLGDGEDAVLTIPDSALEIAQVGPDAISVVKDQEIRRIFKAVNVLGLEDFTNVSFDASIVSGLVTEDNLATPDVNEDETVALFDSIIIRATITDVLTEQDLGGTALLVPNSAKDAEGYLTQEELGDVVKAMQLVIVTDPITHETSFDVDSVLSLEDTVEHPEIDTLLASEVLAVTIGKYLAEMSDVLTVPDSVTSDVACGTQTVTVVISAEIKLLFKAVNALEMDSIESVDFDASILERLSQEDDPLTLDQDESESLDKEKLDDLFGSAVLRATVSEIMTGENLGGTLLVVPKSILDAEDYMVEDELKSMLRSLKLVITTDPITLEIQFEVDSVLALPDAKINLLLTSEVIAATIGQYLIDMGDPLVIPSNIHESITLKDDSVITVVSDTEIRHLLAGVAVLEFTTFEGFQFDATIIQRLAQDDDPETVPDESEDIDTNELTTLFSSVIIQATMSDMMIELTTVESGEPFVIIPEYELDEVLLAQGDAVILTIGGVECISVQELKDVLTAIFYLGIEDLNNLDSEIMLSDIIANIVYITNSSILQATLSEQLLDTAATTGSFLIPKYDENGIQIYFGPAVCGEDYITTAELNAMFYALEALGFTDLNNFTGVVSLGVLTPDKVNKLTASAIIQAKISEQVNSLESAGTIVIPTVGLASEAVRLTVDLGGADEVRYISKTELANLLWALDALGVGGEDQMSDFGAAFSLDDITDNLSTLLDSVIIHATISGQLLDLDLVQNIIIVPDTYADGTGDILQSAGGKTFIIGAEIEAFMGSLELIGFGGDNDITGFTGAISLSALVESTDPVVTLAEATANQILLLSSAIMQATISDTLIGLPDEALIVPAVDESGFIDILVTHSGTTFITDAEVMALINAFGKMGLLNVDTITTVSSSLFFANRTTILLSASMQATISDKMLNDTGEQLVVPDDYRVAQAGGITLIQLTEINAIMDVLEALGLEDFATNFSFGANRILGIDPDVLLSSGSMEATISKTLLASASDETAIAGFSGLIVPQAVRESITVGGFAATTIESTELLALITSLQMLGVSNFDDSFSAATIMLMSEADLNTFLNSGSIHNTIDKMLKGNGNISSSIPTKALFTMYDTSLHPILGVVTKAELVAFIRAVQRLGGNFTTVSLDIDTILLMDEADRNVVLQSMIVRNSIQDPLKDLVDGKNLYNFLHALPTFNVDAEDYEDDNIALFFTYEDILVIINFLNSDYSVLD